MPRLVEPNPGLVLLVFIDAKESNEGKLDTDKDLGQVFDDLIIFFKAQPGRGHFAAVLSAISRNIVVTLEVLGDCPAQLQ